MAVEACGTTQLPLSERKIMQKSWSTIELLCSYNCHSATHGRGEEKPSIHFIKSKKKAEKLWEEIHTNLFLIDFSVSCLDYSWIASSKIFFFISLMISRLKVAHFIDRNFSSIILLMNKERWKINCFWKISAMSKKLMPNYSLMSKEKSNVCKEERKKGERSNDDVGELIYGRVRMML